MTINVDLDAIAQICTDESVGDLSFAPPNRVVFSEGDRADTMFLLVHGHIEINVRQHAVSFLHGPAIFGEMALFEDAPRSATVVTLADCRMVELSLDDFNALAARMPALTGFVVRTIAERLRRTTRYYADMLEVSVGMNDEAPQPTRRPLGLAAQTRKTW